MAILAITPTQIPNDNAVTGAAFVAGTAAMRITSGTDSYTVAATDAEVLVVLNTVVGAVTLTITGQPDPTGRTGNFSMSVPGSASLAAASLMATPRLAKSLWADANGNITIPATVPAGLAIAALRLNR